MPCSRVVLVFRLRHLVPIAAPDQPSVGDTRNTSYMMSLELLLSPTLGRSPSRQWRPSVGDATLGLPVLLKHRCMRRIACCRSTASGRDKSRTVACLNSTAVAGAPALRGRQVGANCFRAAALERFPVAGVGFVGLQPDTPAFTLSPQSEFDNSPSWMTSLSDCARNSEGFGRERSCV